MFNLYAVRFFSYASVVIFMPYYSICLLRIGIFTGTEIALIASLLVLSMRTSAIFFAKLISTQHKKYVIFTALTLSLLGFLIISLLFWVKTGLLFAWCLVSLLLGASLSVVTLSLASFIATYLQQPNYTKGFAYLNLAVNLSAGFGPFLGSVILYYHYQLLPLVSILFLVVSLILTYYLPLDPIKKSVPNQENHTTKTNTTSYNILLIINFLTFVAYAQFFDIFPLFAHQYIGERVVGLMFLISAITITLLQIPVSNWITQKYPLSACIIGSILLLAGVGLLALSQFHYLLWIILGVILFSTAEIMCFPLYRSFAVILSPEHPTFALAKLSFVWGISESLTTFVGLHLVTTGHGSYSFILGMIASVVAVVLLSFTRKRWRLTKPI